MNNKLPIVIVKVTKYYNDHEVHYKIPIMSEKGSDPTGTFIVKVSYDFTKGEHKKVRAYHPRVVVKDRLQREQPIVSQCMPNSEEIKYFIGLKQYEIYRMCTLYNIKESIPELIDIVVKAVALTTFQAVLTRKEIN